MRRDTKTRVHAVAATMYTPGNKQQVENGINDRVLCASRAPCFLLVPSFLGSGRALSGDHVVIAGHSHASHAQHPLGDSVERRFESVKPGEIVVGRRVPGCIGLTAARARGLTRVNAKLAT